MHGGKVGVQDVDWLSPKETIHPGKCSWVVRKEDLGVEVHDPGTGVLELAL
jgi:hypothetical protein